MQFDHLKRREFTVLSSAVAWLLTARAQKPGKKRLIGRTPEGYLMVSVNSGT
jgi:hypothetical protein